MRALCLVLVCLGTVQAQITINTQIVGGSGSLDQGSVNTNLQQSSLPAAGSLSSSISNEIVIEVCKPGTYTEGGASTCMNCPAGTASPLTASTSHTNCQTCSAGAWALTASSRCTLCGVGTFSPNPGALNSSACLACPPNSNSSTGTDTIGNCLCNDRYFLPNNVLGPLDPLSGVQFGTFASLPPQTIVLDVPHVTCSDSRRRLLALDDWPHSWPRPLKVTDKVWSAEDIPVNVGLGSVDELLNVSLYEFNESDVELVSVDELPNVSLYEFNGSDVAEVSDQSVSFPENQSYIEQNDTVFRYRMNRALLQVTTCNDTMATYDGMQCVCPAGSRMNYANAWFDIPNDHVLLQSSDDAPWRRYDIPSTRLIAIGSIGNNIGQAYCSQETGSRFFAIFDLQVPTYVVGVATYESSSPFDRWTNYVASYSISVSNDNINWNLITTSAAGGSATGVTVNYIFSSPQSVRYVKLDNIVPVGGFPCINAAPILNSFGTCDCGVGTYKANGVSCQQCPSHANSSVGSVSESGCFCVANYYHDAQHSCSACPIGTVSDVASRDVSACSCALGTYTTTGDASNPACQPCVAGSYCPGLNVVKTCQKGAISAAGSSICDIPCPADSYCSGGIQTACPVGTVSLPGSYSVTQCVCEQNFSRQQPGSFPFEIGFESDLSDSWSFRKITQLSLSSGSSLVKSGSCVIGAGCIRTTVPRTCNINNNCLGVGGMALNSVPVSSSNFFVLFWFKLDVAPPSGYAPLIVVPDGGWGLYVDSYGAIANAAKGRFDRGLQGVVGNGWHAAWLRSSNNWNEWGIDTDSRGNNGNMFNTAGGFSTLRFEIGGAVGLYDELIVIDQTFPGYNVDITQTGLLSFAPNIPASQLQCSSSCRLGYTLTSGTCTPCQAGYFCPDSTIVTQCPSNTYAGSGQSQCTVCPSNGVSSVGAKSVLECGCNAGYSWTYTTSAANNSYYNSLLVCNQCGVATYSGFNSTTCTVCPVGKVTVPGATALDQCVCPLRGYLGSGTSSCVVCPVSSFCVSAYESQTCGPNATSGNGTISGYQCTCTGNLSKAVNFNNTSPMYYSFDTLTAAQFVKPLKDDFMDKYLLTLSATSAEMVASSRYCNTGAKTVTCIRGSCLYLNPATGWTGGVYTTSRFQINSMSTSSSSVGMWLWMDYGDGAWAISRTIFYVPGVLTLNMAVNAATILWPATGGSINVKDSGGVGIGNYNVWLHIVLVMDRTSYKLYLNGVNYYTGVMVQGLVTPVIYPAQGGGYVDELVIYPRAISATEVTSLYSSGVKVPSDGYLCTSCASGYLGVGSNCQSCSAGSFCPNSSISMTCPANTFSGPAQASCTSCPGVGTGPVGSTSLSNCVCPVGTSLPSCAPCAVGTYAANAGQSVCTSCPANSNSVAGATAALQCNCNTGYYRDINLFCVPCPAGYVCTGNNLMVACPIGTYSKTMSLSCTQCSQGTFQSAVGQGNCLTCPAGTLVNKTTTLTEFNTPQNRASVLPGTNQVYIMNNYLAASQGATLSTWSFYSNGPCTVTPVTYTCNSDGRVGLPVGAVFNVKTVGTTRTVQAAGLYTYSFIQGSTYKVVVPPSGGASYFYYYEFFGVAFSGAACIPYDMSSTFGVSVFSYNASAPLGGTFFPFASKTMGVWSIQIAYQRTAVVLTTSAVASTSIYNCSCGDNLQLADGNCQGMCVDGRYMVDPTDVTCTICPRGSFCTKSVATPCPSGTSSAKGSGVCYPCPGPGTGSSISLVMCGLMTCPGKTPLAIGSSGWNGLGRVEVGIGGDGVVPLTYWATSSQVVGLMLNSTADRPVSLIQQTLSVLAGRAYAVQFKAVCTGEQCGAAMTVGWSDGASDAVPLLSMSTVPRSWTEEATAYFVPTSGAVTVQFRVQMIVSTATVWLGSIELVDLTGWSYGALSGLQLQQGVTLPVRYSAAYVEQQQQVIMQLMSTTLAQTVSVMPGLTYQLVYMSTGGVTAWYLNGVVWTSMTAASEMDVVPSGWVQSVMQFVSPSDSVQIQFSGTGSMSPPSLKLYEPLLLTPCMSCLAGYYCKGTVMNQCPQFTTSPVGSMLRTDCSCVPGYYGLVVVGSSTPPCSICPMNHYCSGGNANNVCPPGTKSQPGSILSGCVQCDAGEYCQNGQVGVCPVNSWSPTRSKVVADCVCMPGYYGISPACTICPVGSYCSGGQMALSCTANASSPVGSVYSSQCVCNPGFVGVNNSACVVCAVGSWCMSGIQNQCPQNMGSLSGSYRQSNCTCNPGYTGQDGGPCVSCPAGSYKDQIGSVTCTNCPIGTSSNVLAATTSSVCGLCSRGGYNQFVGQAACSLCLAGYYADSLGSTACGTCVAGTYSAEGAASCTQCGAGSYSVVVAATDISTCTMCSVGSWALAGSTSCNICGACSYWFWPPKIIANTVGPFTVSVSVGTNSKSAMTLVSASRAIVADNANLYSVDLGTWAVTNLNYQPQETRFYGHVEASRDRSSLYLVQSMVYRVSLPSLSLISEYVVSGPGGASETLDGTGLWVGQMGGLSLFDVATEMLVKSFALPSGVSNVVITPCLHTSYPQYVFVVGSVPFGFRRMSVATGSWTTLVTNLGSLSKCEFTPDGNFVVLTSISGAWLWSVALGTTQQIATGQMNDMLVDPVQNWIVLGQQNVGLIKSGLLIQDSATCSPGLYSLSGGLQSGLQCQTCPAGSLCPGGANITQCAPGTYSFSTGMRQQGQCHDCPPGYFCTGGDAYSVCPLGSYSLASKIPSAVACGKCVAGFYCPNTTVIVVCPSNTNSNPGSSMLADCQCDAGYQCQMTQVIHAQVVLPLTLETFADLQTAYIAAIAAAAGVDPSQVVIVSVQAVTPSGGSRRLLGQQGMHTEVHTVIYGSRNMHQPHKSLVDLSKHLSDRGLPVHSSVKLMLRHEVKSAVQKRF